MSRLSCALSLALLLATAPGAQETVTVYRDSLGIAHVWADTDEAVAYGLGRVHFRDRPVRTLSNLTRAAGKLLETLGQLDPAARLEDDLHYTMDRRALRYHQAARAQWLLDHYRRSGAPAEDRTLARLLEAFVRGINDERVARPKDLAAYFERHASDLPAEMRYSREQFDALFARPVDTWEPLAILTMALRGLWEGRLERHGNARARSVPALLPAGSNAFAVPSGGSESGHTFVYTDSHQPAEFYLSVRFRARQGELDGGGWAVSGTPLVACGFGSRVAWAITLAISDPIDLYTYDGDLSGSPGTFVNDEGKTVPLVVRTRPLVYRVKPGAPPATLTVTDRYLDADEDIPMTGAATGRDGHPHLLYAGRFSYGNPKPPTTLDPGCDPLRLLHRMVTARDAGDALHHALGETLSFTGFNVTLGDAVRAVTLLTDRIPHRKHEIPFRAGWQGYRQDMHMSGRHDGWTPVGGRLYHPVTDLPVIDSDGTTPVRNGKPLKFWASCNSTPNWLLGLAIRFGQPGSGLPFDDAHGDYISPFDPADYIRQPIGVSALHHFGPPWGNITIRQEWITTGLKVAWDAGRPKGIAESLLVAMMTDRHRPLPIYLEASGFFADLAGRVPAGPLRDQATALGSWARERLAPCTTAPAADARDAARFAVFWAFFRREATGPWSRAWARPLPWDFFLPRDHDVVRDAALKALALTVDLFTRYPELDLGTLKRFPIPFGGPELPIGSAPDCGHSVAEEWAVAPWETGRPRMLGRNGGRMPMLMRLRKAAETAHLVRLMMPAQAGRVNTLPEWTATNGPGFHAAPKRWAVGDLYDLPMTEDQLKALAYDPQVTLTFSYRP